MKKLLALAAVAVMVLSVASFAVADDYKVLRFGQMDAKVGYDPQTNTNSGATTTEDCVVEPLYYWNDQNELIPLLAEDFPTISEDGLVYTFKLREGVKFSDGTDLTTDDVKFTFERMFKPETHATSTSMYNMIKGAQEMLKGEATELAGFEAIDDYTFTFTLTSPFSCFYKNLGIIYSAIYPREACEAAGSDWGVTTLIGTGPYILQSSDASGNVLIKNPNYWGSQIDPSSEEYKYYHEPHFDEIDIVFFDNNNTKLMAFENGDIDLCDMTASLYLQYQGTDVENKIHQYSPLGTVFLCTNNSETFNGEKNPLADVRVREAISLAIDRSLLTEFVQNGLGTPATGMINHFQLGYTPREAYEFNQEKARELLAEAGYPDGCTITATIRSQDQDDMVQIQSDLAQVGITMNINVVDAAVWTSERAAGNVQCLWMGWYPLYADADNNIYTFFYSTYAAGKSCFYNNPEFDALMDAARLSTDDSERQKLYEQADEILSRQDYGSIPLYYPYRVFAAQDYVTNFTVGNLIYHVAYDVDFDMDIYNAQK